MAKDFFRTWHRFVISLRLALSIVAMLIMLFFGIVSKEGWLVALLAVLVFPLIIYRDIHNLRTWRTSLRSEEVRPD